MPHPLEENQNHDFTRRRFLQTMAMGASVVALPNLAGAAEGPIPGLANVTDDPEAYRGWQPISDRKIRVGLVGYGVSKFGAAFGFQNHPNVEVVAVSDL